MNLNDILTIVSQVFDVPIESILGKNRSANFVDCRCAYVVLSRRYAKKTWSMIGSSLNRDHSTIIHLSESFEERLKKENDFKLNYISCESILKSEQSNIHKSILLDKITRMETQIDKLKIEYKKL